MVSWPELGTRVTVRYRRPAGSVPPLTDAVGHLLDVAPLVRVRTKTGTVVQFAPEDAVALRTLSDTPLRAKDIRALEHAAAFAWPGTEQHWLDGWLLRAGHGVTRSANSAVPLDASADQRTIPLIVDWYRQRGLTPRLAIPDRLLRVSQAGEHANQMLVRDVHIAAPDPSVQLSGHPFDALRGSRRRVDGGCRRRTGFRSAGGYCGAGRGDRRPGRHAMGGRVDDPGGRPRSRPRAVRGVTGLGRGSRRDPRLHPDQRRRSAAQPWPGRWASPCTTTRATSR